jgi:type I site-specific restriction endonuclease
MEPPGLPVPADPAAVSLFTAHRVNEIGHKLSHAGQRMQAARDATGDLRKYHASLLAGHLQAALKAGHDLTAHIKDHYPDEAAELGEVADAVGLAKAVSDDARAATTSHLLETSLHELAHASRHAQAMTADTPEDEQAFNADHCEKHLGGAQEHVGKLADHFRDNYPDVARWLDGLGKADADGGEADGKQHARYAKSDGGTITGQMVNAAP